MIIKRTDVEYLITDFLEIHYGLDELENGRIVEFLTQHFKDSGALLLRPLKGFWAAELGVIVIAHPKEVILKHCLLLNSATRAKVLYQPSGGEELAW